MKTIIDKTLAMVGFSSQRHSMKMELISGLTTFMTMAYILALNPVMYAPLADKGFPVDSLFTSTALAATIGTLTGSRTDTFGFLHRDGLSVAGLFMAVRSDCRFRGGPALRPALSEQREETGVRDGAHFAEACHRCGYRSVHSTYRFPKQRSAIGRYVFQ